MIIIKCPKCEGCFPAPGPPVPPFTHCPACHQRLRLRPKEGEGGAFVGPRRSRWRLWVSKPLIVFLILSAIVGGAYSNRRRILRFLTGASDQQITAKDSGPRSRTAYQAQRDLAGRLGPLKRMTAEELSRRVMPAVVHLIVQGKGRKSVVHGSGFLVSPDGWLVTNYHVIEGADTATAILADRRDLLVTGVAAVDREGDLALLKVEEAILGDRPPLPCLLVSTGAGPRVGATVYAIGSPEGLQNTISEGLVSGHRRHNGLPVLQTSAPMSHGSSGGPLVTDDGRVVGVCFRILAGGQNLNFAVPAERVVQLLQKEGKPITLEDLSSQTTREPVVAQLDKARKAMEQQKWDEAQAILKPLVESESGNPFVLFAYGNLLRNQGLYRHAVQTFERAVQIKPDYAEAYYNIGLTYCEPKAERELTVEHGSKPAMVQYARRALLKAAGLDPVGKIGRGALEALAEHFPEDPNQ